MSRVVADMNQSRHYASHCITVMLHPCVKLHPYVMLHPYVKLHPYPVMLHGYIISHPSIMLHPYVILHSYVIMLHEYVITHMQRRPVSCRIPMSSSCMDMSIDMSYGIHQGGAFRHTHEHFAQKRGMPHVFYETSHTHEWNFYKSLIFYKYEGFVSRIWISHFTHWNVAPLIFRRTHITHFMSRISKFALSVSF